jgi:hypothetical protein
MENPHHAPPRPRRALTTLHLLLLSTVVAFGVWFGSGWLLGRQLSVPDDAEILLQHDDQILVRLSPPGVRATNDGYLPMCWVPA